MQSITFKQYRNIDLTVLSVFLVLSEGATTLATTRWFVGVPFAISTTLIFMLIGMMRWGGYGVIFAALGGAVFALASGADIKHGIIYVLGNSFCVLSLLLLRALGKERVRTSPAHLVLYAAVTYLAVALGRWLVSLIFEPTLRTLLVYASTDVVTLLFSAVIIVLLRKVDGMIEDQRSYVERTAKERDRAESGVLTDGDDLSSITDDPDYLEGVFDGGEDPEDGDTRDGEEP